MLRSRLYQKFFLWFFLNLILLAILALGLVGGLLVRGSNGLLPAYLFSSNIETRFRTISANLQYKPVTAWPEAVNYYNKDPSLAFTLYFLDKQAGLPNLPPIPGKVLSAAALLPRLPFTLCPDPEVLSFSGSTTFEGVDKAEEGSVTEHARLSPDLLRAFGTLEAGIAPAPRVVYMRDADHSRYWFAQALFVPDDTRELHYMLLAVAADSFSGKGLLFNTDLMLIFFLVVLSVSCLWWLPFVRHISQPLLRMASVAETLANSSILQNAPPDANVCGVDPQRKDEIGRLAEAINVMARRLNRVFSGQQLFLHHIAHEINSPLARIKLGLAVLEDRLNGDAGERVGRIVAETDALSVTTDNIITYLRAQYREQAPSLENIPLSSFLRSLAAKEAQERKIRITVSETLSVNADRRYLERALANVLRNALRYSPPDSAVEIEAELQGSKVAIEVRDLGLGVPENELAQLTEPFFRGTANMGTPGSGLGLSLAKRYIDACNGFLTFSNRATGGFVVRINLPGDM
ncbi:MAG: HAMP domain-containing histidine kinase [Desulfovibrio sp.]|nr:HAMP domain-containing histidine kinase [Desulfovibrio sp.]